METVHEKIKQYRNCALWAAYSPQDQNPASHIALFTITDPEATRDDLGNYQWTPALYLSGGTLEECRKRIADEGHAKIMCQMLWAS